MTTRLRLSFLAALACGCGMFLLASPLPGPAPVVRAAAYGQDPSQGSQQSEIILSLSGESGAKPRYAVPDFMARTSDTETTDAARLVGAVLWDDLAFEREFYMVPRDTYRSVPQATSLAQIPFDRWRELGVDGLVTGTVERTSPTTLRVEMRLFDVRSRRTVMAREYTGSLTNPRLYAHTAADEIHQQQRALRGAARTKLAFISDRDGERVSGAVVSRGSKEVYISDYDGANQRRVTVTRKLNLTPTWSPDGRTLAYTSYRRDFQDLYLSNIYAGTLENPTGGTTQNWLPAWSPDGTRLCFVSNRDGNPDLYVMTRDGRDVRRLTTHPGNDSTPTWSPNGAQIAFTSNRSGSPQIYIMDADGLNVRKITAESYCDRPTWSPAPFNEIAYVSRTGPGYDIRVYDLATDERRQLTWGEGSNESPTFAPNGRHLAFSSTRTGRGQIYLMGRDGRDVRQITRDGTNATPDWSK
jgi:TolB protein